MWLTKNDRSIHSFFSVEDTELMQNHYLNCDLKIPIFLWGVVMLIYAKKEEKKCHHMNAEPKEPLGVEWKCSCATDSRVITRLNAAPSLSVVLNLQLVPEVCCRPPRPMKEYRLFVIGSVTTECTRQQMRNRKKCFGGWNVMWTVGFNHWTPQGCYRLPSMLLKAKGSFRPGFAVIRPDGVSDHNFLGPNERQWICESKSKLCG